MSRPSVDVFFYGLFLDPAVLDGLDVAGTDWRRAQLDGFELRIGKRAYLAPAAGSEVHGAVMTLTEADVRRLYDREGLSDYRPTDVVVTVAESGRQTATCYNLEPQSGDDAVDRAYARSLARLLTQRGFSQDYVDRVAAIAERGESG